MEGAANNVETMVLLGPGSPQWCPCAAGRVLVAGGRLAEVPEVVLRICQFPRGSWGQALACEFEVSAERTSREGCLAGSIGSLRFRFRAGYLLRWIVQCASI